MQHVKNIMATIYNFLFISVGAENPSPFRGWDECDS